MSVEIRVPTMGDSITEATVGKWLKKAGDAVAIDEPLVELETDKVTLEVNAPAAGSLREILIQTGETVAIGAVLGQIAAGAAGAKAVPAASASKPAAAREPVKTTTTDATRPPMPAAARTAAMAGMDVAAVTGTGKSGQVTKGDVLGALLSKAAPSQPAAKAPAPPSGPRPFADREERVRMTRLRKRIAERLKDAQNTAAMLTTFNEVDMSALIAARNSYKDLFEKKHGVRLGFMGFFVKAAIVALKELPAVNAEIEGDDLVYKNYYHIGVAVGTPQGLVVPVVRDADQLSLAGIEKTIGDLGRRARDGKLSLDELQGGTFTISNGGVYGSLLSTPILNPPQSAILGMHKTQDRAVVINGKVEVRPMMYLALSYDHRIIDGREAVTALVRIKECLEDPQRILLDL